MYNLVKKSLKKIRNKKLNLGIIFAAVILVVLATLGFLGFNASLGTAELVFSFPGGEQRVFSGEIVAGMTVFDAILASAQGGDLSIDYSIENSILEIKSVNDIAGEGANKWHVYLNGEAVVAKQMDLIEIKNGDKIELNLANAK